MSDSASGSAKISVASRGRGLTTAAIVAAVVATAAWLWVCWCLFPVSVWNDVRLAPSLALVRGIDFYPPQDSGIVTTWMYGPLPAILWAPAVLASTAIGALLAAGTINLVLTVAAIAATAACWPGQISREQRISACLLALVIWPYASFQYLQADNVAIALGLFANLLLVRARRPAHFWIAALLAVAPIACKQTSVGIAAAQIAWLAVVHGRQAARTHVLRCAVTGVVLGLAVFGPLNWRGVWFNMVTVPGNLPWAPDPVGRVVDMAPELLVQLAAPILILIVARRRTFTAASPVLLPALAFLCTLPPSLAAFFKFGGTLNSLQGFSLWLPAALLWLMEIGTARPALARKLALLGAAASLAIVGLRCERLSAFPTAPFTRHYEQAAQIAKEFPGQIWFPWNPLITAYSEGKFYHAEDGMCMRYLADRPLSIQHARAGLPAQIRVIALPKGGTHWGIAVSLKPADAQVQDFGYWTLHSWAEPLPGLK